MPTAFHDHPRKIIIREKWDGPFLQELSTRWNQKYLYFGLPGPKIYDLESWKKMIRKIIAFELELENDDDPRKNIAELNRNLTLLGIPYNVFCGPIEIVLIEKEDYDGKVLDLNEFITLFNLDFCGPITQRIQTRNSIKCLRFEALRELISIQRDLFRRTGADKFVILLTLYDSFHVNEMERFIDNRELINETKLFIKKVTNNRPLPQNRFAKNTELLNAFVFCTLREYLRGQNIKSLFLPVVSYQGRTPSTPMIHFSIICKMQDQETAQVVDDQKTSDYLAMRTVRANDDGLIVLGCNNQSLAWEKDSIAFVKNNLNW